MLGVSSVRFLLSHFEFTSLCSSVEGTKMKDVTEEGLRRSQNTHPEDVRAASVRVRLNAATDFTQGSSRKVE